MPGIVLVGRSSSHFSRLVRIFALELGIEHAFRVVYDLTTVDPTAYADNPALKIPILVDDSGPLFGAENICRELVRRAESAHVVLRGDRTDRVVANAEELALHVMNSEVSLIMAKMTGQVAPPKVTASIENSLSWLDRHWSDVEAALPSERVLSFVEAALFCTFRHLPFREVMDVSRWTRLAAFAERFDARGSARSTEYRFDAA